MSKVIDSAKNNKVNPSKNILFFSMAQRVLLGIGMNIIGPIIPLVVTDLKVGLSYIGSTISIGTFALLIAALIVGFLVEFFGFKKVIFGGAILIILGCLGLFFSYSYSTFTIAYLVLQLGIGTIVVTTMSLVGNHYFEHKSKNILMSSIGMNIGNIIAPLLVSLIVSVNIKWQILFLCLIIAQIFLVFLLIFLKIPKKDTVTKNLKSLLNTNWKVVSHPYIILCCLAVFLYISTTQTFYTWFTSYFSTLGIKLDTSSLILTMYTTAIVIGMFVKSYLVKYIEEKKLLLANISLSFIFLLSAFFTPNLLAKIILIFLFGLNIAGNFSLTLSIGLNIGPGFTNVVSGLLHAFSYLGVIIFQYLSGYLSEYFSKNSVLYIDLALLLLLMGVVVIINKKEFEYFKPGHEYRMKE